MKRSKALIPAADHGVIPGDGKGMRNYNVVATKGGRNATTNESKRGAGVLAPKPSNSSQKYLGSSSASAPVGASMARVRGAGSSSSGPSGPSGSFGRAKTGFAMTNLRNKSVGQPNPNTGAVATKKPKRKGLGSSFYGEY